MVLPTGTLCGNCDATLIERPYQEWVLPYCPECKSWWDLKKLERVHRFRKPAPRERSVSLVFEPNETDHDDLVLRVGKWAHRSDSYYYELDHPADEPSDTVASIRAMLSQWLSSVSSARVGDAVYLPHDFSDQCTGWIRCKRISKTDFEIVAGWSLVEGYSFYPSDYGDVAREMADFEPIEDFEPFRISRQKLLADIVACDPTIQEDS
jgi:Zn-finger nucleic acid-binding protein